MSLQSIKERLRDVPGIQDLHMQILAGRQTYSFGGKIVALDAGASESQVIEAIRAAVSSSAVAQMPAGSPVQKLAVEAGVGAGAMLDSSTIAEVPAGGASDSARLLPQVNAVAATLQPSSPQGSTMTNPGSFSASIKAMMDEARAGVAKARSDGLETVKGAIGELDKAKTATANVSASMAQTIKSEASDIMAELGQISNDLGV